MLTFYMTLLHDEAAKNIFAKLYHEHRHTMFWTAQQILQDHHLAEDAVHDAFLRILTKLDRLQLDDCNKTRALVVIIVRNIALDMIRKKKRQAEQELPADWDLADDDRYSPEQILFVQEDQERLRKALKKVKPTYVDVLILNALHQYTHQEIAELTGLSPENIRIRLYRGRRQLANLLKEED